uniref:Protein yippee-like n=1 Tax=Solanum lycopersicum TaxID=4081 RepID=A0A3Q7H0I9_SOLLC
MSCVLCRFCGSRVAFMEDYISINEIKHGIKFILRTLPGGIFKRVFNVLLLDKVNYNGIIKVQSLFGTTVASVNCGQCRTNLGWKFVAGTQQNMFVMEGIFLMKLDKLRLCNVENADQDGDANEQAPNDQGGDANEAVPKIELMEMLMNRLLMIKMEMLMNKI